MQHRSALLATSLAALAFGCSHASPPEATSNTTPVAIAPEPDPIAPTPDPEPPANPEPLPNGVTIDELTEIGVGSYPRFPEALDACASPEEGECTVTRTASYDATTRSWIVLEEDRAEYGVGTVRLVTLSVDESARAVRPAFENVLTRRRVSALRRALAAQARREPGTNLVTHTITESWSISAYNAYVALGGELQGYALWIGTGEIAPYTLNLNRRGEAGTRALATLSDSAAGCREADAEEDEGLDDDVVGAEGGGCTPIGIDEVLLAPDHSSLLVLGTRMAAGHGGAPAFHWVVPLPADVFAPAP